MAKPAPPVLYHYTSEMHLGMILRAGHLRLTESNIGFDGSGPRVVWLTSTRDPGGNGLDGGFGKGDVKMTVDASGLPLHHWPTWSFEQGIEPIWYDALDSAGGNGAENWWVCTREIPLDRILSIEVNGVPVHDFGRGRMGSLSTVAERQFRGLDGRTYGEGVWFEAEPDKWVRSSAHGECPSTCHASLSEGKWEWMARATTFIGAPHENRAGAGPARGSAKTLADAQARAEKSLTKDHEFFRKYDARMQDILSRTTGSLAKTADEDQCPHCAGDSLMVGGVYECEDGHVWHPDSPEARAFHDEGSPLFGRPLQQFGEFWPIPGLMVGHTAAADWKKSPGGNSYRTSTVGKNGITYYVTGSFEAFRAFWERPAEDGYASPQWCGTLSVWTGLGRGGGHEVFKVQVNAEHRRQGVASAMFDLAKVDHPDLTHSGAGALSEDGKGFAAGHPASLRTSAAEQQVEVSGVALVARDTGRVLFLQRALTDNDDNGGKWEFPGGHHEEGDTTSLHAAIREWEEEVGQRFPEGGEVIATWTSPDGIYRGHVVAIAEEAMLALHVDRVVDNPDEDGFEQAAWWAVEDARKNPALREECKKTPWDLLKVPVLDKTAHKEGSTMDTPDEFGSLFDDIPVGAQADPLAATAVRHTAEWGFDLPYDNSPGVVWASPNAEHPGLGHQMTPGFDGWMDAPAPVTIDDDPEAALPVTYGEDEDVLAQQIAAALSGPRPSSNTHSHTIARQQPQETEEERGRRLLAYVDASLRGEEVSGPNPFSHISAGQADNEIAAAAANHLATKTALRTYDPQERQAIIDEGIEVRAGNLDRLDIKGTHYEALAATGGRVVPEDEDLTFLDGDPNLSDF